MQKGSHLQFDCLDCGDRVTFSLFRRDEGPQLLECPSCQKGYKLDDPTLLRQLKKFQALCHQIHESEEILADACIGVDVAEQQVKIPFRLLLTRFNSLIDLKIGDESLSIKFRLEPSHECKNSFE